MAPVKTLTHSEVGREGVIHTELNGSRIEKPSLIACRVTGDIVAKPGAIRMDHQARYSGSDRTKESGWQYVAGASTPMSESHPNWAQSDFRRHHIEMDLD